MTAEEEEIIRAVSKLLSKYLLLLEKYCIINLPVKEKRNHLIIKIYKN